MDVGHLKDVLMMDMLPSSIGVLSWDVSSSVGDNDKQVKGEENGSADSCAVIDRSICYNLSYFHSITSTPPAIFSQCFIVASYNIVMYSIVSYHIISYHVTLYRITLYRIVL